MKTLKNVLNITVILLALLSSCKEHDLFELDGKREYIQGSASSSVLSGRNRVKINFAVPNSAVKLVKIYWNNRQSVKEVQVTGTGNLSTIISPLAEGSYNFELIGYDAAGNASVPYKLSGTALGASFEATLANRGIKDLYYDENGTAVISWDAAGQALEMQLNYTDQSDVLRKVVRPSTADTTQLVKLKPSELSVNISYKTAYLPTNCIDTFYAAPKEQAVITGSLKALAAAKGIDLGNRIFYGYGGTNYGIAVDGSPNGIYTALSKKEYNMGQAYWGATRWVRVGGSDFSQLNTCINWFKANNGKAWVTLLTGPDNYMPDWFVNGAFTPAEMDLMLRNLVNEMMESNDNKNKIDIINVANELFNNDGTYRTNMRWNDMGWEDDASALSGTDKINLKHPAFVGKAFQYCREKTKAILELRDYNFEQILPTQPYYHKQKALFQLVKHLKAKGYPIDAVGIQAHYTLGEGIPGGYDKFKEAVAKFKALGVKVMLTELDVAAAKVNNALQPWNNNLAIQQKTDYYNIIKAALDAGVTHISLWGVRDDNDPTWKVGQFPLLFDADFKRKPAYYGVQKALFEFKK
ncbi:endo-1,4-beta-xylanase [Nubsella zeaxanthinifaciens]|uniref:endo-1,4-beta-xylanase n=1 Tax=Nubsella zeaxanthinifaciens TaxID=392412 RepID=UPI000DE2E0D5|nr:endo-1,4-beta-xylanase [Nubsella zeaxanthinifaciens]